MTLRLLIAVACLFAVGTTAAAEDYAALFEKAIDNISWDVQDEWAYSRSSLEDGKLWNGRFDPRRDEGVRWELISVDGREPTAKELKKFAHDQKEHDSSSDSRTTEIVGADSLELLEETDDYWLFTFVPDDDEDALIESVDSKVKIIKAGHYVESIDIRNHSDIRPGFGTKLTKFVMRMEFGPAIEDGPIVMQSVKVNVAGRALFFIGVNELEATNFSDFEHVVE